MESTAKLYGHRAFCSHKINVSLSVSALTESPHETLFLIYTITRCQTFKPTKNKKNYFCRLHVT